MIPLILLFLSCSNARRDENLLRYLDEGLVRSNSIIARANMQIHHELTDKLKDPSTAVRARVWDSIAQRIDVYSQGIEKYIDALYNGIESQRTITREKAGELYKTLIDHKEKVLKIHPAFVKTFGNGFTVISEKFDSAGNQNEFYNEFIRHNSPPGSRIISV
jgi:hypothetical protein